MDCSLSESALPSLPAQSQLCLGASVGCLSAVGLAVVSLQLTLQSHS